MAALDGYIKSHPDDPEDTELRNAYFELSNSEKAYTGQVKGLYNPVIMARREANEKEFQAAVHADSTLSVKYGKLIDRVAELQATKREQAGGFGAFLALTDPNMSSATLHRALLALQIVGMQASGAGNQAKDLIAELDSVPQQPEALDDSLMVARFRDFSTYYGANSSLVKSVLGGRTPEAVAKAVHDGSALADSAGAVNAIAARTVQMTDPALQVVRRYLPTYVQYYNVVGNVFPEEDEIGAELGKARFALYGTSQPPDATFSLRVADGVVKGYDYNGTEAPWHTTFYGLYDRHFSFRNRTEWALPDRWKTPPPGLDLSTPLDFVSTADIIGGNSGSPVLNENLDIVGLVFDGNIESLPGDYIFMPEVNRAVAVDIRAILAALTHVYGMDRLAVEMTTGRTPSH
jgi:Peptidase S46